MPIPAQAFPRFAWNDARAIIARLYPRREHVIYEEARADEESSFRELAGRWGSRAHWFFFTVHLIPTKKTSGKSIITGRILQGMTSKYISGTVHGTV